MPSVTNSISEATKAWNVFQMDWHFIKVEGQMLSDPFQKIFVDILETKTLCLNQP